MRRFGWMVIGLALLPALPSCDSTVEPFQESGYYFSIGGVIDASLDTQFVRVNPPRQQAVVSPDPYDIVVTTQNLTTGEENVWRDSVFVLFDGRFAHNFWTTDDFEMGQSYRLTGRRSDGMESYAEVELPDTVRIVVQQTMFDPVSTVNVFGAEKIADLKLLFCGTAQGTSSLDKIEVSLINRVSDFGQGFTVRVDPFAIARDLHISVYWIRIAAIAAGEEWPDFGDLDEESLALPKVHSNVDNGVGYLGGVTSAMLTWPGFAAQAPECVHLLSRW